MTKWRILFMLGAIGLPLLIIGFNIWWVVNWSLTPHPPIGLTPLNVTGIVLYVIGMILTSIGVVGFWRYYGVQLGIISLIPALLIGWFPPLLEFLPNNIGKEIFALIAPIVTFLLWGATMTLVRPASGGRGLLKATGALFIIVGILGASLYAIPVAGILLILAGILGIYLFLTLKAPRAD